MTESKRRGPRQAEAERNDRALLRAARHVLAADGEHASVAAIAAAAGVGIGSLYRRYRTKEELFQRLAELSLDNWNQAAERGLAEDDPWEGLASFVAACVEFGQGSLAPIAGTIKVTKEMQAKSDRSDELLAALVARAHQARVLRPDVTVVDISLLIEQFGRSPALDQLRKQGREDLVEAAAGAHQRVLTIAVDGLRACHPRPLPGDPPSDRLFTERWAHETGQA
ncbi:TetR family transcriptional regulator [Nonomuraea sp. SMC257]|uniref:TetR family transcriptional regulator n=1 Tax=Nonomuraea montanisoli TaxID=2741721 RepID=A0A7Y6IE10_9ACTN|nr:TetR family transcriptional regulator [Nonomuraea montanisoli]NUW36508.1 TetR family transcriptional regulator [Nonomuraea montanisoli]